MYLASNTEDLGIKYIYIFQIDLSINLFTIKLCLQEALFCYTSLYS